MRGCALGRMRTRDGIILDCKTFWESYLVIIVCCTLLTGAVIQRGRSFACKLFFSSVGSENVFLELHFETFVEVCLEGGLICYHKSSSKVGRSFAFCLRQSSQAFRQEEVAAILVTIRPLCIEAGEEVQGALVVFAS